MHIPFFPFEKWEPFGATNRVFQPSNRWSNIIGNWFNLHSINMIRADLILINGYGMMTTNTWLSSYMGKQLTHSYYHKSSSSPPSPSYWHPSPVAVAEAPRGLGGRADCWARSFSQRLKYTDAFGVMGVPSMLGYTTGLVLFVCFLWLHYIWGLNGLYTRICLIVIMLFSFLAGGCVDGLVLCFVFLFGITYRGSELQQWDTTTIYCVYEPWSLMRDSSGYDEKNVLKHLVCQQWWVN